MPDKLTDKEIVKTLECCAVGHSCKGKCPLDDDNDSVKICTSTLSKSALDLINRQKEDLAKKDKELLEALKYSAVYKTKVIDSEKEINRLQAENERLKAEIKFSDYLEYETTNQIKAEAYKEIIGFLEKRLAYKMLITQTGYECAIIEIKNRLKELVGDNNESKT